MIFGKKAITPIISTFLLIGFAIGLGLLVMSWGNSYSHSFSTCDDVSLDITSLEGQQDICIKDGNIVATLENNGAQEITRVKVALLTDEQSESTDERISLKAGEFKRVVFRSIGTEASKILKIRLIPYSSEELCSERRIELQSLANCAS